MRPERRDYPIRRRNIGAAGKKYTCRVTGASGLPDTHKKYRSSRYKKHLPCDRSVGITRYAEETSEQQVKNTPAVRPERRDYLIRRRNIGASGKKYTCRATGASELPDTQKKHQKIK